MNPYYVAGLVTVGILWLLTWALCASAKANDHVHHPASVKPSSVIDLANWKLRLPGEQAPAPVATSVPVLCPVCLQKCATASLSESGGTIGGWIELASHECVKARTV